MIRFRLVLVLLLAASSCAKRPAAEPGVSVRSPPERQVRTSPAGGGRIVASLAEIAGEWDVVDFDGHPPPRLDGDGQRHAYVNITARGLGFAITCNHSGMAGRVEGGVLYPATADRGIQTLMGCGAEREARDAAFFRFFRSQPRVSLMPDGRLRMAGHGQELLLERAEIRRLATGPALSEITGAWRVMSFTRFESGGGVRGWGPMYAPGQVLIGNGRLSYSRCPARSVLFAYQPDFVLKRQDGGNSAASLGCGEVVPAPTEVEPMLAALLDQSPAVERIDDQSFTLRSTTYAVVLSSEAEYQRVNGEWAAEWERRPG